MPRRRVMSTDAPPLPPTKPEGMPEEVWNLGRKIGNVALAGNFFEVVNGARPARDVGEVVACLDVARKIEAGALTRYAKLAQNSSLDSAKREAEEASATVAALAASLTDPSHIFDSTVAVLKGMANGTGQDSDA